MNQELDIEQQSHADNQDDKYNKPNSKNRTMSTRNIIATVGLALVGLTLIYNNQNMVNLRFRHWAELKGLVHVGWFSLQDEALDIKTMGSTEIDNALYKLSRWEHFVDYNQWSLFVRHGYEPLNVLSDRPFTFMEIGVGVGAWVRTFLRAYPLSTGVGIDYEESAIEVAKAVLPASQITVHQLNMFDVPETFRDRQFDYLFIPGTLCYAESFSKLTGLVEGLITNRVIKSGGKMSVTMIHYSKSSPGSCITAVEKEYWSSAPGWKVLEIQDQDDWKLPHSLGRYAVYLQAEYY